VVAIGAAIQGGVLDGIVQNVLLLDVTPLSLGIETLGGVMTTLIEKNTTIPAKKTEIFSTAEDNQPAVTVHALQGEREMAADNKTLGRFELVGIAPAPRRLPQIEVTFDIDADGIVNVSARDKGTGKEQSIQITASSGLSQEEIDRLVRDAEMHAEDDRQKRDLVDARNQADALIYTTEKSLSDMQGKADPATLSEVEDAMGRLKESLPGNDVEAIRHRTQGLTQASHKLAESAYRQSPGASGAQDSTSTANTSNEDDTVVDAEYEEVA